MRKVKRIIKVEVRYCGECPYFHNDFRCYDPVRSVPKDVPTGLAFNTTPQWCEQDKKYE